MDNKCVDVPVGLFVLRADNVVVLGALDERKEKQILEFVERSSIAELWNAQAGEREKVWNFDKW